MEKKISFAQLTGKFFRYISASKTILNSFWLMGDKVFTLFIGIFVTALVARYLGPENYGLYNYALAFVTLFTAISTLGLDTLSIKSLVQKEEKEGTVLFTTLMLRVFSGILLTILSSIIIRFVAPNESLIHILVLIMSLAMIIKSLEVIEYWIQAHQKSKISSLIRMTSYVISALLKILLVVFDGSLINLSLIYLFDVFVIGIALIVAYFKTSTSKSKLKFKFNYAKSILRKSWYLIISGLMITAYMQIDKIMLGNIMSDTEAVGIYSVATQISGIWYFVPLALITSFKPVIMKLKLVSEIEYLNTLQLLYSLVTWIGIFFGIFLFLFSNIIIYFLYGEEYREAVSIIIIIGWSGIFATLGSARSIWLLTENLQRYTLIFTFFGFLLNISLNFLLIPDYGAEGAAYASLIAQVFANVFVLLFFQKTRHSTIMMLKSFSPFYIVKFKKNFVDTKKL